MSQAPNKLAGVLLAAGESSRLGQPKQLLLWRGKTLVDRAAQLLLAVADAGVVVVTGAASTEVATALQTTPVEIVLNERWATGMASSLLAGIDACDPAAEAALLILSDQPEITVTDINALCARWRDNRDRPVAAVYNGVLGVPAIIPRKFWPALRQLEGDTGAARWLRSRTDTVKVAMPNAGIDIDTPDDLQHLQADS